MKIQIHRGDKTITLTAKQAAGFAFKAGDRVEVIDHGQVRDVTLSDNAAGLRVAFEDGQVLVMPQLVSLLRDHKVSVSLGEQAVLLDGVSGKPLTYDMVAIADPSDVQEAPVGPADMRVLPDLDQNLEASMLGNTTRLPAIHQADPLSRDVEANLGKEDGHDGPLTGARAHGFQGGAPEASFPEALIHHGPAINNTDPGAQALLASDPTTAGQATDPISTFLRSLPPTSIGAVTPAGAVPVTPTATDTAPVVTPDTTPIGNTTDPGTPVIPVTPVTPPSPPPPPSSGGGGTTSSAPPSPPPPPLLAVKGLDPTTDTGAATTDGITTDDTPTIEGTGAPGAVVHVMDGALEIGTATVGSNGTWSLPLTVALAEGTHSLTAVVGTQTSTAVPIVVDLTAAVAGVAGLTAATDTGASATDGITKLGLPVLTGTTDPNAKVEIFDGITSLGTVTADTLGKWTFTPAAALGEGTHSITSVATDPAGNVGVASAATVLTVDLTNPAIGVVGGITAGTDTGAPDGITANGTPTLTGTAEVGSTVEIFDGATSLGKVVAIAPGTWSFTPGTALPDGPHSLTAVVTDPAGNAAVASAPVVI
ncbi:MAG: type secretion C-terminal target protein, partial [Cyanobacteria bacterium RYN_339]|nr:type secretion C-terminal target protein [Cyanobacteria bacterium RYN_339]